MRAATLAARLEELGVLRSFSRPHVSNNNPFSESLLRTAKCRPDYPSRLFNIKEEDCAWGGGIRGLVQPPAPLMRHQIGDTLPES
jgi:transposase InsO family protein